MGRGVRSAAVIPGENGSGVPVAALIPPGTAGMGVRAAGPGRTESDRPVGAGSGGSEGAALACGGSDETR